MATKIDAAMIAELRETLTKSMAEDASQDIMEVLKEKGFSFPKGPARLPMSKDGAGKDRTGGFKSFGEFLHTVYGANNKGRDDERLKSLQESSGETGGFLIPEQFRTELMNDVLESATFRPRARVIPITGPTAIPRVNVTTHSSSVFGGVVAYWRKEGADLSGGETEPTFGQVRFEPKDLIGYTQVSNQLLADSAIALEPILRFMFSEAIVFYEEESFFNGDGAGEPLGIANADCTLSIAKETGQAPATIVTENLDKMYARMLPRSVNRAMWFAHPDIFPQLAALSRSVGVGGSPVWFANIGDAPPTTIYGRPVIFTEHCQTLGTTGDLYFADPAYYIIADRQSLAVSSSEHVRFATNETVWRFIERLDGAPWLSSAITPKHGSNSFSCFLKLDTRS